MCYIAEPLSGEIFLTRKIEYTNYFYWKNFPIYGTLLLGGVW